MDDIVIKLITAIFLNFVYGTELEICNGKANLYIFEEQAVEVIKMRTGFHYTHITPCRYEGSAEDLPPYDPVDKLIFLTFLRAWNTPWPSMPITQLKYVELYNVTPRGGWGFCTNLTSLIISDGNFTMISPDWLSNCTVLEHISLSGLSLKQMSAILDSTVQVETVIIDNITDIDNIVQYSLFTNSSKPFKKIYFRNNGSIEHMNVSWAEVSAALTSQLSLIPGLRHLDIRLQYFDLCPRGNFRSVIFESLTYLNVEDTNTTRICFRQYRAFPRLEVVSIGSLSSVDVEFGELFSTPTPHNFTVYGAIKYNNLHLNFTRADYLALPFYGSSVMSTMVQVVFYANILVNCDGSCSGDKFWFTRAMRMRLLWLYKDRLYCENGGDKFVNSLCERLDCERVPCEGGCVCCRAAGGAVVGDCRDAGLRALPAALLRLRNLTELLAPNNTIAHIPDTLPDTLLRLDLSGNRIEMNASEASALFAVRARRVRLAGNPIDCTCDNQPLLDAVLNGSQQIEDIGDVKCFGDTKKILAFPEVCKLREVNITLAKEKHSKELAIDREATLVTTVAVTTVLAMIALVLGVALYYRRTIQIILFARGWCLCWLRDDDSDEDRRYDVFLSFCHEDAELVLDQLLPALDQHYSVCVHLRDWVPGDMIPANIRRSVEESRITLVILSKHFAKSLWGLLEFQTAYACGLDERRIRVVMVVLDDVLESQDLNKDFREYVRFNTYVRWGDPWFWSKLQLALPHPMAVPLLSPQRYQSVRYTVPALLEQYEVQSGEVLPTSHSSPDETI